MQDLAALTLGADAAVEFDAEHLATGNVMKGLSGRLGGSASDLEIDTDLAIELLALVRAPDGTIAAMHDTVRETVAAGRSCYEVLIFNPWSEVIQASRLRLINPGDATGAPATGGEVRLTLPPGGARTLTAQQLEAGDSAVTGRFGAGVGRWTLSVSADRPIRVVNVAVTPTGDWHNLSTTAEPGPAPADHLAFSERLDGLDIVYETDDGRFTLTPGAGDRYAERGRSDQVPVSLAGAIVTLCANWRHWADENQNIHVSPPSDSWGRHPPRGMAVLSFLPRLSGCRGSTGGTRNQRFVRNGAVPVHSILPAPCEQVESTLRTGRRSVVCR